MSRIHPIRLVNLALLLCLAALVAFWVVPNWRQIRFRYTGQAVVDGSTFYLHPGDNHLTPWILRHGEYEPTETNLVREILKKGDVFIDVGANIGWYTVHASKAVGETGKVIAFEPEPKNLDMLRRNVQANGLKNVVVDDRGLSSTAGSFKLFLEPNNLGMHSLVVDHGGKHYINVETIRFDDYWKNQGDIKLIKIDTEGAEGLILDGMRGTLKSQSWLELILEFAPRRLEKSGYDPSKLLEDLYGMGFKASLIDEESRRIVYLGTPKVKELPVNGDDFVINLHLKRR